MKPNRIVMKVYGKYALFTDPMTKIGGEKSSMMIPSYETLKGIVCGNYWKPSVDWIIESVKVLNPIRTERKGIRPIKYNGGNDLSYYKNTVVGLFSTLSGHYAKEQIRSVKSCHNCHWIL